MKRNRSWIMLLIVVCILSLTMGACQPQAVEEPVEVVQTVVVEKEVEKTVVVEVEKENVADNFKLASIFPGVITDADYNTLAYIGSEAVQSDLGVEMAYSEAVAVPDVDRVMREYIDGGYNIIFVHGNQFISQALELANAFPEVYFIVESDGQLEVHPDNVWVLDRNFHTGFYAIGAIAAKASRSGKIGYVAGPALPFTNAEYHAMVQAITDQELGVEIVPIWVGDFNDPTKARQVADQLMADGVDVLVGSLNLGMFGIFEGAKAKGGDEDTKVLVTAKYSDKSSFAPDNYITALLYDFTAPLMDIVGKIMAGETKGYYTMEFGSGVHVQMPLRNVDPSMDAFAEDIVNKILDGTIEVVKDTTALEE